MRNGQLVIFFYSFWVFGCIFCSLHALYLLKNNCSALSRNLVSIQQEVSVGEERIENFYTTHLIFMSLIFLMSES